MCLNLFNLEEEWVRAEQPVSMVIEKINILLAASLRASMRKSTIVFEIIGFMGVIRHQKNGRISKPFIYFNISGRCTLSALCRLEETHVSSALKPGFVPSSPAQCVYRLCLWAARASGKTERLAAGAAVVK